MQKYMLILIISLALIGFHINNSSNQPKSTSRQPRSITNPVLEKKEIGINFNELGNELGNENENEIIDENDQEDDSEPVFNEMGDILNAREKNIPGKKIIDITTFKGEGLPSAKPEINPSSKIIDANGLVENFGSYRDNFPYESSYLKTIKSENLTRVNRDVPITKGKNVSNVSKVILPTGIKEYVEDFDFFRKTIRTAKDSIRESTKVLIIPHERVTDFNDRIINVLPDEIVFKTRPDPGSYVRDKSLMRAEDNEKKFLFNEADKKIQESKSFFKLNN